MKTLVLFTSSFPFGNGEAFIESEFPFLCNTFERIIIVTNELKNKTKRTIPENVIILRYPYSSSFLNKVRAVFSISSEIFRNEVKFIREKLRLSLYKNILYTLLGSIAKGLETRDFIIDKIIKKYSLNLPETWFYAYWMNDMAIGLAMLKEQFPEAKTICRAHRGDLYFYTNYDNYLPLRTFLLSNLSKCYVISENGKEYLTELLGEKITSNVILSRLGTSNPFKRSPYTVNDFPVMVSCSTLTTPKRVNLIAEAISKLSNIKLKWLHFGEGTLRAKIETEANKLLLKKESVEFSLMGNYTNSDLLKFYSESPIALFINVSSSEGIPVSIMEAMSFGIPVIATAAGGTTEIVKHEDNGYLLNVIATSAEIAKAITKYFSLIDSQRNEMSDNAYKIWNENYNADKNYKKFTEDVLKI